MAPSYSERSRNNEDGGLAFRELWTESLSHCRPPELQLREVRFHTGPAQSKTTNNSTPPGYNLRWDFTSTKIIIIFLLSTQIYVNKFFVFFFPPTHDTQLMLSPPFFFSTLVLILSFLAPSL